MPDAIASPARNFAERLRAGRFVMTAEVAPPVSCDPQDLLRKATPLRGLADAVNITDGAGARAHMAALAASALLIDAGIEPILQIIWCSRGTTPRPAISPTPSRSSTSIHGR
jgi:methylenetetrahydrofolate reductase (NADPH)